jgi:hypothetical protein
MERSADGSTGGNEGMAQGGGKKARFVWCRLSVRAPDDTDTLAIHKSRDRGGGK